MKKLKLKKRKPTLQSTFTFDRKQAIRMCKIEYYKAQARDMKMYEFIQSEKLRLGTPKKETVTQLLDYYKNLGEQNWQSSAGKTLLGIYKKNKDAALNKRLVTNENLLSVLSKPETLLLAYKAIKGNKGALTRGADKKHSDLEQMTDEQRILYVKSKIFPDQFSLEDILLTSKLLHKGLYPWGSSSRVYFPKPGVKDKKRPITIPPFLDRVVQKAICMVLEAIYEPEFELLNRSFGFRPNKSVHDAMVAVTSQYSSGKVTAVEGDIEAAYDTVNKDRLVEILGDKIKDRKFLNLIKARLDYDYVEKTESGKSVRFRPPKGIPQGGIDSPYLFNIYMHELDKFVHTDLQAYIDSLNAKLYFSKKTKDKPTKPESASNKAYTSVKALMRKFKRYQGKIKLQLKKLSDKDKSDPQVTLYRSKLFYNIKMNRRAVHRKNRISSKDNQRVDLKILYIRYADDWILLTNGCLEIGNKLKEMIKEFLLKRLELKLSDKKTVVTDIRHTPAKFLGFELKHPERGPLTKVPTTKNRQDPTATLDSTRLKKSNLQRRPGTIIWAAPDRQRLISRMHMKGFCDKNGFPREMPWLSTLEPHIIIERYNSTIRGLAEFYIGYIRSKFHIQRWIYIMQYSCYKTLAQKYKTSIRGVFKKFGYRNITGQSTIRATVELKINEQVMVKHWTLWSYKALMKVLSEKKTPKVRLNKFWTIEHHKTIGDYPAKEGNIPTITNDEYLEKISWVSLRTQASFDMPCANCGELEDVHQHHVRHVRKNSYAIIPQEWSYKQVMALRNRKQIPLCRDCHIDLVHQGAYQGIKLMKLVPTRLYDNRTLHVESYVKPGVVYHAKSLEEKGWRQVGNPNRENIDEN
jgi:retron-type reverse transcriptase